MKHATWHYTNPNYIFNFLVIWYYYPSFQNALKRVKLHKTAYSKNHSRVWLRPRPCWRISRRSQGSLVTVVNWDRINPIPPVTTLSTVTSRPMSSVRDCVRSLYLFSGGCTCPQTPSGICPWTPLGHWQDFLSPDPCAGCVHAPAGLCMHIWCLHTRQRFAVFRLSVNKVTSQADKTCTSQVASGSTTSILSYHDEFCEGSYVDISVYKNAYNNCHISILQRTPENICINLILPETTFPGLHFCRISEAPAEGPPTSAGTVFVT